MTTRLVIGEFSRATHITVKALRHYHDRGLLVPAAVDEDTGYRYYDDVQIGRAQLIRRLRELEMPLADVEAVLDAPTSEERDAAIAAHLARMEQELERTRGVVGALRELLTGPSAELAGVSWRTVPDVRAAAVSEVVPRAEIGEWCEAVFPRLFMQIAEAGLAPAGPGGATFSADFFEAGVGAVVAFVPVADDPGADAIPTLIVPGTDLGIAEHVGSYETLDRTYGQLARAIADTGRGRPDPIREYYLVSVNDTDDPASYRTEVCWPVTPDPPPRPGE